MSETLLPCPWCGSHAQLRGTSDLVWGVCMNVECRAEGPAVVGTEAAAIAAWNRRTPAEVAALRDNVAELVGALEGMLTWVEQRPTPHPYDTWKAAEATLARLLGAG